MKTTEKIKKPLKMNMADNLNKCAPIFAQKYVEYLRDTPE